MQPILSICIPTYKRVEILKASLESIYSQDVDNKKFNVCITDNSPTDETKDMLEKYFSDKTNLIYKKTTCKGFLNTIEALKLGTGDFLKLNNNYCKFTKNGLQQMIDFVEKNKKNKPVVFFRYWKKNTHGIKRYDNFDGFAQSLLKFITWSAGFSIWKEDFGRLISDIEIDEMFPHLSFTLGLCDKNEFIIDYNNYMENTILKEKSGYNLPDTFMRRYIEMLIPLNKKSIISDKTMKKEKNDILKFLALWRYVDILIKKYTFSFDNCKKIIKDVCGPFGVVKYYLSFILVLPEVFASGLRYLKGIIKTN